MREDELILSVPNKLMFAYIKKQRNLNKTFSLYDFRDLAKKLFNIEVLGCHSSTANYVTSLCENTGHHENNYLNISPIIIHKSLGIKNNVFVSNLGSLFDGYFLNDASLFFFAYKNYIDVSGFTYIISTRRFVTELIRNEITAPNDKF